jgi:hypothetical protein
MDLSSCGRSMPSTGKEIPRIVEVIVITNVIWFGGMVTKESHVR